MASQWFYTREGQSMFGPFSAEKLKQMAASGQILPTDKVRRVGKDRMVTANRVKGLFAPAAD